MDEALEGIVRLFVRAVSSPMAKNEDVAYTKGVQWRCSEDLSFSGHIM